MAKIGQNLALSSIKWHKKNLIGENGGERKINPSANPVTVLTFINVVRTRENGRVITISRIEKTSNNHSQQPAISVLSSILA